MATTSLIILITVISLLFIFILLYLQFISTSKNLYNAHFARINDIKRLLSKIPASDGLLLGIHKQLRYFLSVRPTKERREIANMLIVAPTGGGKGLLAVSQLLSWKHSAIVNDIKGELFHATAGYRNTLGKVFVINPTGIGNGYNPLAGKQTEGKLSSAATSLLYTYDERDPIFTQRATVMLTRIFLAAAKEGIPALVYTRELINLGLPAAAERINNVDPKLATRFLDTTYEKADFTDKFLKSCWSTLTTKIDAIIRDPVIRSLIKSDFSPENLLTNDHPVTIYLTWKEQDLLALSPLIRLIWSSLIDELLTAYDAQQGKNCKPVLILIDEAGRTAIPSLADHATTVRSRNISLWIAIQSLSQLTIVYGKDRAQMLRDNMESQIYYRPTDLETAKYLEDRIGQRSGYAHSYQQKEQTATGEGLAERPVPLITAQEILKMKDHEIIAFHRRLPPIKLNRIDWRNYPELRKRKNIPAPKLLPLPELEDIPPLENDNPTSQNEYIDPDQLQTRR